ncbi:hypothetical protein W97_06110 [Coniosporium apollinis CBS 100218]|uniref:Uncharacterized protein n=1 Tax=Coniosporium apollinis (strain CBS 100218) TaxID=1168221 RepID=R7YYX2_CONA1|nr:uncharacterized protein W97_06110 [Coniosporium apollinis CBS 100218]EON66994.1 hypothetical protein W97_06110 [Coniosporium apollinis CBS 100218]
MNNQGNTGGPSGGKDDFLDKGLTAVQKKYGGAKFSDPNKNKATNEKITDKARSMFEKTTGMKVPKWLSN